MAQKQTWLSGRSQFDVLFSRFRWKRSFLFSLLFGLPVFIITMTYMILMKKYGIQDLIIIPGLSLENFILFSLCSIVMVSVWILFWLVCARYVPSLNSRITNKYCAFPQSQFSFQSAEHTATSHSDGDVFDNWVA